MFVFPFNFHLTWAFIVSNVCKRLVDFFRLTCSYFLSFSTRNIFFLSSSNKLERVLLMLRVWYFSVQILKFFDAAVQNMLQVQTVFSLTFRFKFFMLQVQKIYDAVYFILSQVQTLNPMFWVPEIIFFQVKLMKFNFKVNIVSLGSLFKM